MRKTSDHLLEPAYSLGRCKSFLRAGLGVGINRQMKHLKGHNRVLQRRLIALPTQPRIHMPRGLLPMANRDSNRPLARHHIAACENSRMSSHHVQADLYHSILCKLDSGYLAKKTAIRLLTQRQHNRVGFERFELAGRLGAAVSVELHHLNRKIWADDLFDAASAI